MAARVIYRPLLLTRTIFLSTPISPKCEQLRQTSLRWSPNICTSAFHTQPLTDLTRYQRPCIGCGSRQQHRWLSQKTPTVKPPSKVPMSLLRPYMKIMERMESWLGKKYPKAHHIYMLFKLGVRDFFVDMKIFYKVAIGLRTDTQLRNFSHTELDVYRRLPWDMLRVAPVLIISALPFMNYVVFPIAYFFPRQLLCRHFWTPQQRIDFRHYYLSHRVHHYPKILHYLDKHTKDISNRNARKDFSRLMYKIHKGGTLSYEEILSCKPLFETGPFSLQRLGTIHKLHMWHLSKSLHLSTRVSKLSDDILLLHFIDRHINEAGVSSLTMQQLQQYCFTRGMEAKDVSRTELEKYLIDWVQVSLKVDENSLSLLLHCPVFLAYNNSAVKPHFWEKPPS